MPQDSRSDIPPLDAADLLGLTCDLLSEAGELACPSATSLMEYLIDRLPEATAEARA